MRVRALVTLAAGAAVLPLGLLAAPASAATTYDVTVVHGIPLPAVATVDVYVDNELALDDLAYEEFDVLTDVPAGTYAVAVTAADAADASAPILSGSFPVSGDVSIVAQLDAAGAPQLTPYTDDFSTTPAGQARVVVRHAAAAPPVGVTANGQAIPNLTNLANGNQATVEIPAGTYAVAATVGGAPVPGLSVPALPLVAGNLYTVHAVGNQESGYTLIPIIDEVGQAAATPTPSTTTSAPATTTKATTTSRAIPTAVNAGDGTSGWTGPLGLPALLAITLAAGAAVAVGLKTRGTAARRR